MTDEIDDVRWQQQIQLGKREELIERLRQDLVAERAARQALESREGRDENKAAKLFSTAHCLLPPTAPGAIY
jgi:hypothetical protein